MNPQLDDIPIPVEKKSYKKPIIIASIIGLLVIGAIGYVVYQANLKKQQEAAAAQLLKNQQKEAAAQEAKLKQSTVAGIEDDINTELNAVDEERDRFIAENEAQLQQEADQSEQVGEDNASNM